MNLFLSTARAWKHPVSGSNEIIPAHLVREYCKSDLLKKQWKPQMSVDPVDFKWCDYSLTQTHTHTCLWFVKVRCVGVWTPRSQLGRSAVIIVGEKVLKYPVCTEAAPPWDNAGVKDEPVHSSFFTCEVNISLFDTHPKYSLLYSWVQGFRQTQVFSRDPKGDWNQPWHTF